MLTSAPMADYSVRALAKSSAWIGVQQKQERNKGAHPMMRLFSRPQFMVGRIGASLDAQVALVPCNANPVRLTTYLIGVNGGDSQPKQEDTTMCELTPVTFHGDTLYVVDYHNQPYVPMKAICEGMGLDWSYQYRKLQSNQDRWKGVAITATPLNGKGGEQQTLCLPLRKLPGWMMTLQPSRVAPEKREKIIQYQNECDDALWEYWNGQQQETHRPTLAGKRWILSFDHHGQEQITEIPEEASIVEIDKIPQRINEANGRYYSSRWLLEMISACTTKLQQRESAAHHKTAVVTTKQGES